MIEVVKIADSAVTPLGIGVEENLCAVLAGESGLTRREGAFFEIPDGFTASLIEESSLAAAYAGYGISDEYTVFEKRAILSAALALGGSTIDPSSPEVLFVLSSTKGNVALLDSREGCLFPPEREYIGSSAMKIASFFGNQRTPLTVSNACISGLSAQIVAMRALQAGLCKVAVVVGCDVQSRFTVSGFQCLKALSPEECRPFDAARKGLNLGDAASTIVYTMAEPGPRDWVLCRGAVRNDANHITGPSRTAEGLLRAIEAVRPDPSELAFVGVHGTATVFNDEMEATGLHRAGLDTLPVTGLKGTFGHTLGTAGVLETVLSMRAVEEGYVLPTRGYSESGVTYPLPVSPEPRRTGKKAFLKVLSGFGGCNAAAMFKIGGSR